MSFRLRLRFRLCMHRETSNESKKRRRFIVITCKCTNWIHGFILVLFFFSFFHLFLALALDLALSTRISMHEEKNLGEKVRMQSKYTPIDREVEQKNEYWKINNYSTKESVWLWLFSLQYFDFFEEKNYSLCWCLLTTNVVFEVSNCVRYTHDWFVACKLAFFLSLFNRSNWLSIFGPMNFGIFFCRSFDDSTQNRRFERIVRRLQKYLWIELNRMIC